MVISNWKMIIVVYCIFVYGRKVYIGKFRKEELCIFHLLNMQRCSQPWCCRLAPAGAAVWAPPPGGSAPLDTTQRWGHPWCETLPTGGQCWVFAELINLTNLHLQLSMDMWQCCSSNGYIENFIEHERRRVSLRINHISLIGTRWENENLLHHVKDFFRPIEPNIVVRDRHCLEGNLLGILEVGVWSPDPVEPLDGQ